MCGVTAGSATMQQVRSSDCTERANFIAVMSLLVPKPDMPSYNPLSAGNMATPHSTGSCGPLFQTSISCPTGTDVRLRHHCMALSPCMPAGRMYGWSSVASSVSFTQPVVASSRPQSALSRQCCSVHLGWHVTPSVPGRRPRECALVLSGVDVWS